MLTRLVPLICPRVPDQQPAVLGSLLLVLAVLLQAGVLVSLSPGQRRAWSGVASGVMGALALVGAVGAMVGALRIRAQLDSVFTWCNLHLTAERFQSIQQAYRQANDLSQQFQRFFIVPVAVFAVSIIVAVVVVATSRRGRQRMAEPGMVL
jgi:hypothetical protein